MRTSLLISLCAIAMLAGCDARRVGPSGYVPREYYGARLEPVDQVLHGAGQSQKAFVAYSGVMPAGAKPVVYMAYMGLRSRATPTTMVAKLKRDLDKLPFEAWPQIGVSMTRDGKPSEHYEQDVAAGLFDGQLHELFTALQALKRPVFLRIGYECNGRWNGYQPESYKAAFRHVVGLMRRDHPNLWAASVWCIEPGGNQDFMAFYPGDEWVDWWSVDLFSTDHFEGKALPAFLAGARQHQKPVMIGESTPRRVGVGGGAKSWDRWFARYFELIRQSPGIKAFCYINWDWSTRPAWKDWGDARLESNAEVAERYRREMALPLYQHAKN